MMSETIKVKAKACAVCGESQILELDRDATIKWQGGELIQNCFPDMPLDEREILISGTHPACWDTLFGGDDEDE